MAVKFINPTDYASDAAYPIAAASLGSSNSGSWTYTGFARVPKNTAANYGALLVSGYDGVNASGTAGVALIQLRNSSNVLSMTVTKIAPNTSSGVKFGYWDGDDGYWYIGVFSPAHRYPISVVPIMVHGDAARRVTIDNYYPWNTTAPTGWTEVDSGGNVVYCPPTDALASIAELKTFLTTKRTAQVSPSVGFYLVRFTAAASPFVSGARVNVQLNVAEGANGVAILTTYGTSNPEMYLMRLYNGTWGLPKKVTVAT